MYIYISYILCFLQTYINKNNLSTPCTQVSQTKKTKSVSFRRKVSYHIFLFVGNERKWRIFSPIPCTPFRFRRFFLLQLTLAMQVGPTKCFQEPRVFIFMSEPDGTAAGFAGYHVRRTILEPSDRATPKHKSWNVDDADLVALVTGRQSSFNCSPPKQILEVAVVPVSKAHSETWKSLKGDLEGLVGKKPSQYTSFKKMLFLLPNPVSSSSGVARPNFKRRQLSPPLPKNGGPGVLDFFCNSALL